MKSFDEPFIKVHRLYGDLLQKRVQNSEGIPFGGFSSITASESESESESNIPVPVLLKIVMSQASVSRNPVR